MSIEESHSEIKFLSYGTAIVFFAISTMYIFLLNEGEIVEGAENIVLGIIAAGYFLSIGAVLALFKNKLGYAIMLLPSAVPFFIFPFGIPVGKKYYKNLTFLLRN